MGTNRLSGLISGMDTEALVTQLVSGYKLKKENVEKEKTRLEWKQEKWKELNTKIYNLYSKTISNMQYTAAYQAKSTTVSDSTKASVVAGDSAPVGTHIMSISRLAKAGQMTGAKLTAADGSQLKADTKLEELGITSKATLKIKTGKNGEEKTIEIDGNTTLRGLASQLTKAGLSANFDVGQQRFYVNSAKTGTENDFTLEGNDAAGVGALIKLGLATEQQVVDSVTQEVQDEWVKWMGYADAEISMDENGVATVSNVDDAKAAEIKAYVENAYQTRLQEFTDKQNKVISDLEDKVKDTDVSLDEVIAKYDEYQTKLKAYNEAKDNKDLTDEEKEELKKASDEAYKAFTESGKSGKKVIVSEAQIKSYKSAKEALGDKLGENTQKLQAEAQEEFWGKVKDAQDSTDLVMNLKSEDFGHRITASDCILTMDGVEYVSDSNSVSINGLTISAKNTTINEDTGVAENITIVTDNDYDKVYDNIKEFIKGYNELMVEMEKLYGADSAKGYDPLTSEEKEALSEDEVEKWEKKIKDSLLRRDATLDNVTQIMKNTMASTYEVDGVRMSLADFGINTLSYFMAADNEKACYHINGDKDDSKVSGNADALMKMITTDSDKVTKFFTQLSKNLYTSLGNAMKGTELRSAYTVYNDKQLKSDLDEYDDKISDWEEKIQYWEDYYYKQFSEMETALSKLQTSSSALASMMGG